MDMCTENTYGRVHAHAYGHVYKHVNRNAYGHVYTHVHVYGMRRGRRTIMEVFIHKCMRVDLSVNMCMCIDTRKDMYASKYVYRHMYLYDMCMDMHMCTDM